MPTYLSAHFSLEEFSAASTGTLSASHQANANYFATRILEPVRRAMGFPIKITSFYRAGDRLEHGAGNAIDFQPCRDSANTPALFDERMEAMFQWLASYKPAEFGKLIHERTHLHATVPGAQGRTGQVLREPTEGNYVLASIAPVAVALLPLLAIAGLLLWMSSSGKRRRR